MRALVLHAPGHVDFAGVSHDPSIRGGAPLLAGAHRRGGSAPVRRLLPGLMQPTRIGKIDPGTVAGSTLPLEHAAEGCRATLGRRAAEVLLIR